MVAVKMAAAAGAEVGRMVVEMAAAATEVV